MLKKIWDWITAAILEVVGFLWALLKKNLLEAPLLTIFAIAFPALFAATLMTKGIDAVTPFGDAPNQQALERATGELGQMRTTTVRTQKMLDDTVAIFMAMLEQGNERERSMAGELAAAKKRGDRLLAISRGSGTVDHSGGGTADSTGSFSDPWIDISVAQNKSPGYGEAPYDVKYDFTFSIHDINTTVQETNGAQYDLFSVWLKSDKDAEKILSIGNYTRKRTAVHVLAQPTELKLRPPWSWNDWAVSGDLVLMGPEGLEAGLSVSPFSIGDGAAGENAVIIRWPEAGASSDIKNTLHIFGGIRLNIGHWLPLFSDLYLSVKYGYEIKSSERRILVGFGTRL